MARQKSKSETETVVKKRASGDRRLSTCSPSSDAEGTECVLKRYPTGKIEILTAPPIFICTRESVEDLLGRHNAVLSDLTELRDAVRSIRDVKGRHHTQLAYERLIALLPENVECAPTGAVERMLK